MKKTILIMMAVAMVAGSCQKEIRPAVVCAKIAVCAPSVLPALGSIPGTKAADIPPQYTPMPMKPGSTLWLIIEKKENGVWEEDEEHSMKSYVVSAGNTLFPCDVDDDGNALLDSYGAALMLPEGTYRFHAVSPARRLRPDGAMPIRNGDYVVATDTRWEQTSPKDVEIVIESDSPEMQTVELNPLINQTARIKVNVKMGRNVKTLSVLPEGIEISGIQEDHVDGVDFIWHKDGYYIPALVGNKYEGTLLADYDCREISDASGSITGYASILPTDARTNSIFFLFNLMVNEVPTQYLISLNDQYYAASFQYEYNFTVNVDGGITLATWDNITIVQDVDMTDPD